MAPLFIYSTQITQLNSDLFVKRRTNHILLRHLNIIRISESRPEAPEFHSCPDREHFFFLFFSSKKKNKKQRMTTTHLHSTGHTAFSPLRRYICTRLREGLPFSFLFKEKKISLESRIEPRFSHFPTNYANRWPITLLSRINVWKNRLPDVTYHFDSIKCHIGVSVARTNVENKFKFILIDKKKRGKRKNDDDAHYLIREREFIFDLPATFTRDDDDDDHCLISPPLPLKREREDDMVQGKGPWVSYWFRDLILG